MKEEPLILISRSGPPHLPHWRAHLELYSGSYNLRVVSPDGLSVKAEAIQRTVTNFFNAAVAVDPQLLSEFKASIEVKPNISRDEAPRLSVSLSSNIKVDMLRFLNEFGNVPLAPVEEESLRVPTSFPQSTLALIFTHSIKLS